MNGFVLIDMSSGACLLSMMLSPGFNLEGLTCTSSSSSASDEKIASAHFSAMAFSLMLNAFHVSAGGGSRTLQMSLADIISAEEDDHIALPSSSNRRMQDNNSNANPQAFYSGSNNNTSLLGGSGIAQRSRRVNAAPMLTYESCDDTVLSFFLDMRWPLLCAVSSPTGESGRGALALAESIVVSFVEEGHASTHFRQGVVGGSNALATAPSAEGNSDPTTMRNPLMPRRASAVSSAAASGATQNAGAAGRRKPTNFRKLMASRVKVIYAECILADMEALWSSLFGSLAATPVVSQWEVCTLLPSSLSVTATHWPTLLQQVAAPRTAAIGGNSAGLLTVLRGECAAPLAPLSARSSDRRDGGGADDEQSDGASTTRRRVVASKRSHKTSTSSTKRAVVGNSSRDGPDEVRCAADVPIVQHLIDLMTVATSTVTACAASGDAAADGVQHLSISDVQTGFALLLWDADVAVLVRLRPVHGVLSGLVTTAVSALIAGHFKEVKRFHVFCRAHSLPAFLQG